MVVGEIGLSYKEYYNLTQRQLFNLIKGYNKRKNHEAQQSWEQTRKIAFITAKPNLGKKYKNLTEQEFMPFPWDIKTSTPRKPKLTREQQQQLFNKIDKK